MKMSRADKKWYTFNKKLQQYMDENNFWMLGTTYYQMAGFKKSEDREFEHLRQKGFEMKTIAQKDSAKKYLENTDVISQIEVLGTNNSCPACKEVVGKVTSVQEAINNPPVPTKDCTNVYGCTCTFVPVVE